MGLDEEAEDEGGRVRRVTVFDRALAVLGWVFLWVVLVGGAAWTALVAAAEMAR